MFYCDACGGKAGWPCYMPMGSFGPCEVCGKQTHCNNYPSKHLPLPKNQNSGDLNLSHEVKVEVVKPIDQNSFMTYDQWCKQQKIDELFEKEEQERFK